MSNVQIIHGDCLEYMATLPDKAFELAIVDPPYGIDDKMRRSSYGANEGCAISKYRDKKWDNRPDNNYFNELKRVSIHQIIWGANYFINQLTISSGWIFWDKDMFVTNYSDGDIAWTSFEKPIRLVKICWSGFRQSDMKNKEHRIHPTQKPVALYQWLLKNYAKQGDKILDTHLGSGSSAIAADIMGFDFTGIEIDKDYYEAALDRFNRHKQQIVMEF